MPLSVHIKDRTAFGRRLEWSGESPWPSLPMAGETWFCCGDWAGADIRNRNFMHDGEVELVIVASDSDGWFQHLIDAHGFRR